MRFITRRSSKAVQWSHVVGVWLTPCSIQAIGGSVQCGRHPTLEQHTRGCGEPVQVTPRLPNSSVARISRPEESWDVATATYLHADGSISVCRSSRAFSGDSDWWEVQCRRHPAARALQSCAPRVALGTCGLRQGPRMDIRAFARTRRRLMAATLPNTRYRGAAGNRPRG